MAAFPCLLLPLLRLGLRPGLPRTPSALGLEGLALFLLLLVACGGRRGALKRLDWQQTDLQQHLQGSQALQPPNRLQLLQLLRRQRPLPGLWQQASGRGWG